jgi:glycerate kinase
MAAPARPVVVAPDKFRGTLPATGAAAALGRGLARAGLEVDPVPVADGGEGTMEALAAALGARIVAAEATDPLGRRVTAAFALTRDGRLAVVEAAQASGLWRVAAPDRDAVAASTTGTGELIGAAIEAGAREVIVGVGGSAATDGGRGALEALGARFSTRSADLGALRRRLRGVTVTVACDVRNPLLGAGGAARMFGPQKGAAPHQIDELEQRPGAALVLDRIGFDARMRAASVVVTGEGRLDEQTLGGKAVFEVATRCRQGGVPCYAIVGQDALDAFGKRLLNIEAEEAGGPGTPAERLEQAARRLGRRLVPYLSSASARTTAS